LVSKESVQIHTSGRYREQWQQVESSSHKHRERMNVWSQVFESVTEMFIQATRFLNG